jgi:hypothetical protein
MCFASRFVPFAPIDSGEIRVSIKSGIDFGQLQPVASGSAVA